MRKLSAHPRLIGLALAACALCAALIVALAAFSRVEAQNTQNKTMRALVESLIARQKANKGFSFSVKLNYNVYNSADINFDIADSESTIAELGDDHICLNGKSGTTDTTFCYPYSSITLAYAK